jgi:hypothetical protein
MKNPLDSAMLVWAARDAARHPGETLLAAFTLSALVAWIATVLLLTHALESTARKMLETGPSLVVRRVSPGGWVPIPAGESVRVARAVPGVTRARARVWGLVSSPSGPVTAVGIGQHDRRDWKDIAPVPFPGRGEAVAGPGVPAEDGDAALVLAGARTMSFKVSARLPPKSGLTAHDIVVLHAEDARLLLGLPEGHASDLALDVFHPGEEEAILPDLAEAFPWPVRITTRSETVGLYSGGTARRGGIALVLAAPAILAAALLVAGSARDRVGRRREVGLLKAMGWTTGDVVRLHLLRAAATGLPATALGLFAAYLLVLRPGVSWPGALLFGWHGRPPGMHLSPSGAWLILLEVAALAFVPWLAAHLWPSIRGSAADPQEMIQGGDLLA